MAVVVPFPSLARAASICSTLSALVAFFTAASWDGVTGDFEIRKTSGSTRFFRGATGGDALPVLEPELAGAPAATAVPLPAKMALSAAVLPAPSVPPGPTGTCR